MNALELRAFHLTLRGGTHDRILLSNADLVVEHGGLWLISGPSGTGKSSLLRACAGILDPHEPAPRTRGSLRVLGVEVSQGFPKGLRSRVTAVLQDEGLLDELSPRENVELALRTTGRSEKLAIGLLSQVGLGELPPRTAQLSGGQRKRVALARALAGEPELIFLDEPTAGLDKPAARTIAELMHRTQRGSRVTSTVFVITHDLESFEGICTGVILLDGGQVRVNTLGEVLRAQGQRSPEGAIAAVPGEDAAMVGIKSFLLSTGAMTSTLIESISRLPPVYPRVVLAQTARYVVEPLPFVLLSAAATSGLATYFALRNNPLEGALTAQVLTGCGKVLTAVLGPLVACVFFTARMSAGAAARIGTMRRTNQTHALELLGIRPADWLLTPLVWSMAIAMPVAALCADVVCALASLASARLVAGTTTIGWAEAFFRTVDRADLRYVIAKGVLSGVLVAIVTYHLAMTPKRSGKDVANAVNSSIVLGLCVVLLVHSALTVLRFG